MPSHLHDNMFLKICNLSLPSYHNFNAKNGKSSGLCGGFQSLLLGLVCCLCSGSFDIGNAVQGNGYYHNESADQGHNTRGFSHDQEHP